MKTFDHGRGYLYVGLSKYGNYQSKSIHRLVAETFIPNPDNLPCVNHIDENTYNNRVDNLEWCTHKYNNRYSKAKKVVCFRNNTIIKEYNALRDV